jgi:pilus assembly protein Flp/PilA
VTETNVFLNILGIFLLKLQELLMNKLKKLLNSSKGATAIEYGLIAALIAVAAISAMSQLGKKVSSTFNNVSTNLR